MAKTIPTSIRFDQEQLDFLKKRENINSPQKAVNFLLNQYWWQNKPLPLPDNYIDTGLAILHPDGKKEKIHVGESIGKSEVTKVKKTKGATTVTAKVESPYLASRRKSKQ